MDVTACPVCRNVDDHTLLEDRLNVPTLQNTTLATSEEALRFPTGAVRLFRCEKCTFVWNGAFDPNAIVYDETYNNDVSKSRYYLAHLDSMADRVVAATNPVQRFNYVEVGCGDAGFLHLVLKKARERCVSAIGFDPSFTNDESLLSNTKVFKTFFGSAQKSLLPDQVDVLCSRHTIEHVPDVHTFASALASVVKANTTRLLIETPDADWILRNLAFQDIFYEHCSLFTPRSIMRLLAEYGMECEVTSVYGGQYMWIDATKTTNVRSMDQDPVADDEQIHLGREYVLQRQQMMDHWLDYLCERRRHGQIAIWGAASKGVTFNLLIASQSDVRIDCAVDLNIAKQGRYLPATGLPVVSPEEAIKRGVQSVVIMNPNYEHEIRAMARGMNWEPEFVTLNSPSATVVM